MNKRSFRIVQHIFITIPKKIVPNFELTPPLKFVSPETFN